jgi:hypothetical protein
VKRIVRPRMTCTCCEAFAQAELPSIARQAICKANLPRGAPDCARTCRSGSSGTCVGRQILRSLAALSPVRDLCPGQGRSASFHADRLGGPFHGPSGTLGQAHRQVGAGRTSPLC